MDVLRRLGAEFFGTFWLTFAGCGSAVLAAGFPALGIGFLGVSLAFGLTVLTMAYAVGHISGGHFNCAVTAIARGRRWLDEIVAVTVTSVEHIAAREKCSIRQVNMTISLAFLAPELVKAAVEGRLPRGIGVTRLRDAPAEWSRQYAMLGLSI